PRLRAPTRAGRAPALVAVLHPGSAFDRDAMVAHYTGKMAKWCIPDDVVIALQLPHTATGSCSNQGSASSIAPTAHSRMPDALRSIGSSIDIFRCRRPDFRFWHICAYRLAAC